MNPGDTKPWEADDDGGFGEAIHHRLSRLAARLDRLTSDPQSLARAAGRPLTDAQLASDTFEEDNRTVRASLDPAHDPERKPPDRRSAQPRGGQEKPRGRQENTSLAEIAAALRDIERTEPPADSHRQPDISRDHAGAEKRLKSIRERIDALKSRHGDLEVKDRSRKSTTAETSDEPRFAEASPQPTPPHRTAEFNAAVAEIAARQRDIDGGAFAPPTTRRTDGALQTRPTERRSDKRQVLDASVNRRNRVGDLSREPLASRPERSREPERQPAAYAQQDPSKFAMLERQLADIQRQLQASPRASDVTAIAAGNVALLERIDTLVARTPETGLEQFAQQVIHRVPSSDRFDALITEIDRLSERISSLDGREGMARIEARMMGLNEQLAEGGTTARLESEMAGVRNAIEGISRRLESGSGPALARLEERLNQISERIDATLAGAPRAEDTADLFRRLETMARRGESAPEALAALASEIAGLRARERSELANLDSHIQALARRLDEAILGQASGEVAIAELEARLGSLSRRLDELAAASPSAERLAALDHVEEQIRQLAEQVSASDRPGAGMADLEAQVATLIARLELLSADHEALQEVQDNLARVETMVSNSDTNSMQAIRQAAKEAVAELSGIAAGPNARIVDELRADLRQLQNAAHSKERQTAGTLDAVHQTLDRVVARLGNLEADIRAGSGASGPREPVTSAAQTAAQPLAPSQPLRRRADQTVTEDEPLAPGSDRARADAKPTSDRDRRADFIAAARRAAQAAAAEHGATSQKLPSEETDDETGGRMARLRRAIADNRRPILLAVAIIVLAIAAFQIAKPYFAASTTDDQPGQSADAAIEPATETPAALDIPAVDNPPVIVIDPPQETPPTPGAPAAGPPATASPGAAAFMPPAGVTSPLNTPAGTEAAADATAYPMPDEAIGAIRLRVAAADGDPAALYEVGARYADGNGVARDLAEAAIWLERAAEAGLAVAQHRLGAMYEAGLGVDEDRAVAMQWYIAAAEQGNVLAMHNIGVMFSQGIDGTPDFVAAIDWFTLAADHGIRDSQYNLGVIYARGIGVEADLVEAYKWFALAATQGDSDAAARRDDVAAALTPEELATARASVSAWTAETAPASANTVDVPEGGWDAPEERVELGDREELVRTIQALLADRGYDPGPADGVDGPMTRDAARAFQQAIGVQPTGVLDETLLNTLVDQAA